MKAILVIDDEVEIVGLLRYVLEGEGYRILVALNGRDGLEKAKQERPDLVICDIMLPYLDGVEVAKAIHLDPTLQPTPVVLMSGGGCPLPERNSSWQAFIGKPFTIATVVSTVAQLLLEA